MNIIDATRQWLRDECPLIDRKNRFNAGYLGAESTEYSVTLTGETHKQDVLGYDIATYSLAFCARMPYGKADAPNVEAADFFFNLSAWLRGAECAHNYPTVTGYSVTRLAPSNAGMIVQADANTARYQLQLQLTLEEV